MLDDEALIAAVVRVRAALPADKQTAAEVHAALIAEGYSDLTLSQVKKASSKAMKRGSINKAAAAEAEVGMQAAAAADAPGTMSKREAKAAKAKEMEMKAAESHMMQANRTLRLSMGDDEYSAAVATSDRGEKFIKAVTQRALEARLTPAETVRGVPRDRLAADLATLEWMELAEKAGTLTIPEEARASAAAQVARLKRVAESPGFRTDLSWVSECFLLPEAPEEAPATAQGPPSGIDYTQNSSLRARDTAGASLDRAVARAGMLSVGGGFDDDID